MTCRELLNIEHPEDDNEDYDGFDIVGCPSDYGYANVPEYCRDNGSNSTKREKCTKCWDREADEAAVEKVLKNTTFAKACEYQSEKRLDEIRDSMFHAEPKVLDSGDRTEFPSGAVRDCREGKGRCDLMPLDVVAEYMKLRKNDEDYPVIIHLYDFIETWDTDHLYAALDYFTRLEYSGEDYTMLLEVAKQFEEGAKKYGDDNWRKGIPVHCYIDSAIRHYLKYLRGDQDEPHARAFCWNILCCIWTVKHIENGGESNGEGR